ncbi:MAG: hypothetical protein U0X73_04040 [Thermoanaerobaculia bacterium]
MPDVTREEAGHLADSQVKSYCKDYPKACIGLSGRKDLGTTPKSYAYEWRGPDGQQVFVVSVMLDGDILLNFEPGFNSESLQGGPRR